MEEIKIYKNYSPAVSVILPTYNRASSILRAVDSVLSQTLKDWELIIVDDGSSDNTFPILDELVLSHENIRYCKHQNRKLPLALNTGLSFSVGNYVAFLGSDDEYLNNHLETRLRYMKSHPEIDLVYGGVKIIGNEYVKDFHNLDNLIHLNDCVIGGSFFGKRELFNSVGGFRDIPYGEDFDLVQRALPHFNIQKVDIEQTYIYYRDSSDSICNNI
ncbi:MAG: glycosyltransferase family 2 protein [Ignavibacteriaceae bacterium]